MPRKEIDYSKTIMYKIVCNDLSVTNVYVGHTTDFRKRKNAHKRASINENDKSYNLKVYQIIRQNGGWGNWTMIEIEKYCCNDGNEATARERYWFETLNSNMNNNVPNRSDKEYQEQYYINNKEKKNEKRKHKIVCECGGEYSYNNKSQHFKTKKHQNYIQSLEIK
jgi:hypothetical protein